MVLTATHHLVSSAIPQDWHVASELTVYGLAVPFAAWVLLGWLAKSARSEQRAHQQEALANASLAQRTRQIEALYRAGRLLAATRDIDEIADSLLDHACSISKAEAGFLQLYPENEAAPVTATTEDQGSQLREMVAGQALSGPCSTCPAPSNCPMPTDIRCQPIIAGTTVLGLLRLKNPEWDAATRQSLNTLLAEMASTWMAQRAESRALAAFTRAGSGLRSQEDLVVILERFLDLVCQTLGAVSGTLYRLRQDGPPQQVAGKTAVPPPEDHALHRTGTVWAQEDGRRVFALAEHSSLIALSFSAPRPLTQRDVGLLRIIASQSAFLLDMGDALSDIVWLERKRLAGELHDSLAQSLAHLNLQTNRVRDALRSDRYEIATKILDEISGVTLEAYEEVRQTIDDLRLNPNAGETPADFLRRVVSPISARNGAHIELQVSAALDMPRGQLTQIARVIQEALANAIRHGKAKEIVVDLHETRDALILSIADDGISFDAAALPASGHHGMAVMRERIEMLGGRLVIDSANGLGTTVKAEIPRTAKPRAVPLRLMQL